MIGEQIRDRACYHNPDHEHIVCDFILLNCGFGRYQGLIIRDFLPESAMELLRVGVLEPKPVCRRFMEADEAIETLDLDDNKLCRDTMAPAPEDADGWNPEIPLTNHLLPHDIGHDSVSRETTPSLYAICPRVFRLGFELIDSTKSPYVRGFTFGSGPDSNVKLTYYANKARERNCDYVRIHYSFNSGALLITAIDKNPNWICRLGRNKSLLLMAGTGIRCRGVFEFTVAFPDLSNCAIEHERSYQEYAAKLGIP